MAIRIGLPVRWPNGDEGSIHQDDIRREPDHDAYLVALVIKRSGYGDLKGRLRFTEEAIGRIAGEDDVAASNRIGSAFADRIAQEGVADDFFLGVDADGDGIHFFDLTRN